MQLSHNGNKEKKGCNNQFPTGANPMAIEPCLGLGLVNKTVSIVPASQLDLHDSFGYATHTTEYPE